MAFSFRKIFSNINYFKKPEENPEIYPSLNDRKSIKASQNKSVINFERRESDCTSHLCTSLKLPNSAKTLAEKKGSLSDTDILKAKTNVDLNAVKREKRRKCKKLKLDIKKASESIHDLSDDSFNIENTPKHILLDCKSSDEFGERFKGFDFNKSFDLYDELSDDRPSSPFDEEINLDSYSECSDSDLSIPVDSPIKMCRKVDSTQIGNQGNHMPSAPLSFEHLELDKSEEERLKIILDYQMKLEEIEGLMKNLLNEYHYQIEVSKNMRAKSRSSFNDDLYMPKKYEDYLNDNEEPRYPTPGESWDVIMHKEEDMMKYKLKKQLWSMKSYIEQFVQEKLKNYKQSKKYMPLNKSSFNGHRPLSYKKKIKYYDFPDIRDAMINLFIDKDYENNFCEFDESDSTKCNCKCHSNSDNDSDSNDKEQSFTITSSIGNFTMDISTLTAYSESLGQSISYSSFQDSSLYNKLLQKAPIDRITFYVQVHSIELTDSYELDIDTRNVITFTCGPCKFVGTDEYGLLEHILSQSHCEKIHFLYKTAYIKKCVAEGKEIQPSTVLNPMKMYRDDNKIVCFGDAVYACTLCFENSIIGESILMAHCSEPVHVERRHSFEDMLD